MARTALVAVFAFASASLLAIPAALADEETSTPAAAPPVAVPPSPPPTSTVVSPDGSGGVTLVAPTPGGGTVTATGCSAVMVKGHPVLVTAAGAPCPVYAPYQPYPAPPPSYDYDVRPRYARDPDRSTALLLSALVFSIGGGTTGLVYAQKYDRCDYSQASASNGYQCRREDTRGWLYSYGALVTFTPSIPRFLMGDHAKGLVFTAVRGGAFLAATLIDWGRDRGDSSWGGPFLLGFAAPVTLGIIDLATTPHREDLAPVAGIAGVAPIPLADRAHNVHGGVLAAHGLF